MRSVSPGLALSALAFLGASTAARCAVTSPAPDYSQAAAWAAFPGRPSAALEMPAGVLPGTPASPVAVFFVHPTTDLSLTIGNAPYDAGGAVGERVDETVLRLQAGVFNGCCRIYAPRYRQATLRAITSQSPEGYAAADLAYGDVSRAFEAFLRLNPGHPFVLAGHSQGSVHVLRLLEERVAGTPLQRRLVAAYALGVALPLEVTQLGLPVCGAPEATGCVISWNSVRRGHEDRRRLEGSTIWWRGSYQSIAGRPIVCVNPLDWRQDSTAPASANLGAVYSSGHRTALPAPVPMLTGAECTGGLLGVQIPFGERRHFGDALTLMGIYHDFDYSLFYMNLRDNARVRIAAFRGAVSP